MKSRFVTLCAGAASLTLVSAAGAHVFPFVFGLNGRSVVDPTDSTATGMARFTYNHHTFNYELDLQIRGIGLDDLLGVGPNGTPIGVFYAPRGQNGDMVLDPGYFGDFYEDGEYIRLQLEHIRLGGQQGNLNSNVFLNQEYLYDGQLYMQIFTNQYPGGEIRGQIPPLFKFFQLNEGSGEYADVVGGPSQIPAPAGAAVLALGGLLASRRRR